MFSDKVNYFDYLPTNKRKSIALFTLITLSKFLMNKKTNVINIKDLSGLSIKVINDQIDNKEEKINNVDKCIQTDNNDIKLDIEDNINVQDINIYYNTIVDDNLEETLRKLVNNLPNGGYCTNDMQWESSKDFIINNLRYFEYGIKYNQDVGGLIGRKYQLGTPRMHSLKSSLQNIKNNLKMYNHNECFKVLNKQTLEYYLYCIKVFQYYNPSIK